MTITITPTETTGVSRRLQVAVAAAAVSAAEDKAARKYADKVRLPGFRQGKAPAAVVRKKFADAIRQEALESLVNDAFRQAVDDSVKLAAQPHVHDLKFEPGADLTFELHFEVRPEVALEKVDGFSLTRREAAVTDEALDEQLERLREQRATWPPVTEKAMPGDMVTVLLATAEADGSLPEGREYKLTLGGGQAIPGIEELIMEVAPGDTAERPVKWPDDFPDESQRGVSKLTRVTVVDVKRRLLPDLDDAFARELGDFETAAALRDAVRTDMGAHAKREADAEVRAQLIEQVIEANPFEVPGAWVRQLIEGYAQMYQIPQEELARFAEEFKPMATRQVQRDLIIDTIAERESLKASEADIDARIEQMATARNVDPGQVYAQLQKGGRLSEIERELTEERVFTWLLERNTVTAG
ncbi:MAG TPA: trigger factor [Gemmatimonadaceae bacterium]|nr:trigger factor [Gemmatimonadaceae bacterium]